MKWCWNRAAAVFAAAFLTIELVTPLSLLPAEASNGTGTDAGNAGIWFDRNGDGTTDNRDYQLTADWLKSYSLDIVAGSGSEAGGYVRNGNNEAADSIKELIFQETGAPAAAIDYGINVKNVPRYCVNNIGLGTPAGDQTPYGTCWAFAENAAVESAILRVETGYSGEKILRAATGTPQLGMQNEATLLSPLYLATKAFSLQTGGSQRGEGITIRKGNAGGLYNAGGFLTTAEVVYGNWDGPVSEVNEPYSALTNRGAVQESGQMSGSGAERESEDAGAQRGGATASPSAAAEETESALLHTTDPTEAHLQDYYIYRSPAVTEEDAEKQLRVWKYYSQASTNTLKQALVKYGALAIMDGTDGETPGADGMTSTFNYKTWMQYSSAKNVTHNHAVTIVGWDDTIPASSFSSDPSKQPEGNGAWLVKNSWGSYENSVKRYGSDWLQDYFRRVKPGTSGYYLAQQSYNYGIPDQSGHGTGYFWLSYYDHSIAGAAAAAGVDIPDDGYDYRNNYTYQYSISLSNSALVLPASNAQTKVCNVFTAREKESLKAVSVETPTTGVTAEIRIYTYDARSGKGSSRTGWNPEQGTLVASKTAILPEMGLHTVKLDKAVPMKKGQKFAVVEKVLSASKSGNRAQVISWLNLETAIAEDLQTPENYSDEVTKVVSNPGETWAYVQGGNGRFHWVQPKDLNQSAGGDVFQFGNALIHAYTK